MKCGGQNVPLVCPLALLLPSALVAPPEAPTLLEGTIALVSRTIVISESAVMTSQSDVEDGWTDAFAERSQRSIYV